MTDDDAQDVAPVTAASTGRVRQAELDAADEHGRALAERYGRDKPRQTFAVVGHAGGKRRRR